MISRRVDRFLINKKMTDYNALTFLKRVEDK